MRPEIESHAIAGQHARTAVVQAHLDGLRRDEPACTHDQLGAAGLVILEVHGNQADDHVALARQNSLHVGGDGTGHYSEPSRVVNQIGDLCAPNLVLAGKTVGVWARAADQFTLDNGGAMPRPGQVPSQEFAALAAAEDERFIAFRLGHHQFLRYGSRRSSAASAQVEPSTGTKLVVVRHTPARKRANGTVDPRLVSPTLSPIFLHDLGCRRLPNLGHFEVMSLHVRSHPVWVRYT